MKRRMRREDDASRMLNWMGRNDNTFICFVLCVEDNS